MVVEQISAHFWQKTYFWYYFQIGFVDFLGIIIILY